MGRQHRERADPVTAPAEFTTLISADELARRLDAPELVVIDCRHDLADPEHGVRAYADGHVPGAHFLHLDRDLSGPMTGSNGRHPLPDPAALIVRLQACGIHNGSQVVAYDDGGGMYAARLWWLLRWLGHPRVAALDGGLRAWCGTGALTDERPARGEATFHIALHPTRVAVEEVHTNLASDQMLLLDARSPDRFRGENETLDPVGGHVPGARNRFFRDNLNDDGRFKPAHALREDFSRVLGETPPERVVHMCGSGVTACHNALAMEVAGLPGSRLYAGSWSEWCSSPERPVATDPA
ncbi:MAG: sulfurtransferase [Rhodocyclaceae bacterium]|nr:sulfurtransferase [Rhodocyclaceae bacterium]